jgi:C-terminal processing protease CtpA/Prc
MTLEMIDPMLDRLKNTRGIIFDMRGYPNSAYWALPQRLTDKTGIAAALIETPLAGRSFSTPSFDSSVQTIFPRSPDKLVYRGSTVMLIDERTVSQAEHTGLFLRAANGTKFIGSPTAGANGEITTFSLPGGIGTGFSGQSVRHPDGRQLQRVGLVPDIEIRPTIKGIRAGRDEVLDRAVRYLIDR